jgi:hypothetical protein
MNKTLLPLLLLLLPPPLPDGVDTDDPELPPLEGVDEGDPVLLEEVD